MTRTIIHATREQQRRLNLATDYVEVVKWKVAFDWNPSGDDVFCSIQCEFDAAPTRAEAIERITVKPMDSRWAAFINDDTIPAIIDFLNERPPLDAERLKVYAQGDYSPGRRPYIHILLVCIIKPFTPAPWPKAMTVRDQYRAAYRAVRLRSTNESESARAMTGLRQWIIDRARHAYADSKYRHSSCMPQTIEFHTRTRHYLDMPAAREAAHELCGFYYRGVRLP